MKLATRLPHLVMMGLVVLSTGLLSGCGEIVVFGHTVREGKHSSEIEPKPDEAPASPAPQPVTPTNSTGPVATPAPQPREQQSTKAATVPALQKTILMPVVLAPQAAAQTKADSKFNINDLQSFIKTELRSRKMLEETGAAMAVLSEVTVDAYDLSRTSNVVLFGKTYYAGTLNGTLRIRDAQGNELSQQSIEASARIAISEEGETTAPLEPLYRDFARRLGEALTGTPVQSAIQSKQQAR